MMHLAQDRSDSGAGSARTAAAQGGGDLAGGLHGLRILIVEDEAMIAWSLETLFEDMGFTDIEIAATGEEAARLASRRVPDLLVSDINLGGGVDGVAAAAAMRAAADIPVIFVSGYASADVRRRVDADVPGATVLRKPIQPDDLRTAVSALLSRKASS